jgi:hypothetical protein
VFIEDPLASLMASFQPHYRAGRRRGFHLRVLGRITNVSGSFDSHLVNPREPEASTLTSSRDIDELLDNLSKIQITDLIGNHESESGSNSAPTRNRSELESPFGHHVTATVYREALRSKYLSALEKDFDDLLQLGL